MSQNHFSLLHQLTTWHYTHFRAAALLLLGAGRRTCSHRSISAGRRAHSSKPAARGDRTGQKDARRAVSISVASQQRFINVGPPHRRTRIYAACVSRPDPVPRRPTDNCDGTFLSAYKTNDRKRSVVKMYQSTDKAANLYSQDLMLI